MRPARSVAPECLIDVRALQGMTEEAMGPREALEHIRAIINDALQANDIITVRDHLSQMRAITEKAIGPGTLHAARALRSSVH
jgi:hypothetical protein